MYYKTCKDKRNLPDYVSENTHMLLLSILYNGGPRPNWFRFLSNLHQVLPVEQQKHNSPDSVLERFLPQTTAETMI